MKNKILNLVIVVGFICALIPINAKADEMTGNGDVNKPKVIIDSDFSSDVDDVLSLSTAVAFDRNEDIELIGVALCCSSSRAAQACNALLNESGYWDVPVASAGENGVVLPNDYHVGMESYPHSTDYFYDTTNLYRMLLASSQDKVNIITIGQLTNINDLLNSQPDEHSDLTGAELIAEKVNCIYIAGGKHNGGLENNIFYGGVDYGNNKYYNNTKVAEAAKNVADNCPCEQIWLEADITGTFCVGECFDRLDKSDSDIISRALKDYGTSYGSASFDPMTVWVAITDLTGKVNNVSMTAGKMNIKLSGTSYFTENENGTHYRFDKLANDGWYRDEINKLLESELVYRLYK